MQLIYYPEIRKESTLPIYVTGIGIDYAQPETIRPMPNYPHIIITVRGKGSITVGEEKYDMMPGNVIFLDRDTEYVVEPVTKNWTVDWVTFEYGANVNTSGLFLCHKAIAFKLRSWEEQSMLIRSIYDSLALDVLYGGYSASLKLYQLIIGLNREAESIPDVKRKMNPSVAAVIEYINTHYTEELTLERLCTAAGGLSEQYLCRVFKQSTGMRPVEYILKKRIDIARSYLETTDMPIPEVAEKTGFHNTSYFYRNFKKFTGTSPLLCRQNAVKSEKTNNQLYQQ